LHGKKRGNSHSFSFESNFLASKVPVSSKKKINPTKHALGKIRGKRNGAKRKLFLPKGEGWVRRGKKNYIMIGGGVAATSLNDEEGYEERKGKGGKVC